MLLVLNQCHKVPLLIRARFLMFASVWVGLPIENEVLSSHLINTIIMEHVPVQH
jgi:hypothetical protein